MIVVYYLCVQHFSSVDSNHDPPACKDCGPGGLTWPTAGERHATTLLLAGVPVHVVAAQLGHADPSITLRVYAHVISDQLTEAADVFARAIAATG